MIPLYKKSDGVWDVAESTIHLGQEEIAFLENEAPLTAKRRARICAHRQTDHAHQMLIAFCADSRNPMHKHDRPESMYIIKGAMRVHIDGGFELMRQGDFLRIAAGVEHQPEPLCDCVVLETVER